MPMCHYFFIFVGFFTLRFVGVVVSESIAQDTITPDQASHIKTTNYSLEVQLVRNPIQVNGILDEEDWKTAAVARDFFQNFPFDTSYAKARTEAKMLFDEHFVYVGAICYDDFPSNFLTQNLRRDFNPDLTDFFTVYFDPFGDKTNGFAFAVSAYGVQREGMIANGGGNGVSTDWDNKWYSAVRRYADHYIVEMAIPYKSLRYRANQRTWGINFGRVSAKRNETSSWVPVPRNFTISTLAFTGEAVWAKPLPEPKTNVSVIPYLTGQSVTRQSESIAAEYKSNIGADMKVAVTPSLNLDLTFNPDFSQVEVDQQVTNLDRFEIFFPERRQFFLENQDLFSRFGFSRIRPFFSRRIGIGRDTSTGLIKQSPILYGARLSGKLDKDWRIGLLNMQSASDKRAGIFGQNYTVATFQRQMFARSNLAGIFVNRQRTASESQDFALDIADFERIVGLDYNLASADNRWNGKFFVHKLLTPTPAPEQYAHASFLSYNTPNWNILWNHEFVGGNYDLKNIGFVPRRNHWRIEPYIQYKIYPKVEGGKINNIGIGLYNNLFWTSSGKFITSNQQPYWVQAGTFTDRYTELGFQVVFNSSAFYGIWIGNTYTKLLFDFDPTNTDQAALPAGTSYDNYNVYTRYESNARKLFSYQVGVGYSSYYHGRQLTWEGGFAYRIQPVVSFGFRYNYNRLEFPATQATDLLLLSPRIDATFTRNLFLTLFLQYNNQINNINLNGRLQWRFAPVSDLFVVYTDNYFANDLKVKNRALVLKLTYWLNI